MAGPRLLALIGTLTGGYRLSRRLVQGVLQDVFGLSISLGAIRESEAVLHAALAPVAQEAHAHVQRSPVVHSDETGYREKGCGQWMWVAIAGMVSVFMACMHRNAQAAKDLLGMGFAGILVSDRYGAYTWVDTGRRQLCWAHLLRDFRKIAERSGKSGASARNCSNSATGCFVSGIRSGKADCAGKCLSATWIFCEQESSRLCDKAANAANRTRLTRAGMC